MRIPSIYRLSTLVALSALAAASLGQAADKLEYNRDIRPILSDTCFACHGPDARKREAGLRLDQRTGAIAAADSGAIAIVPGKSDESELVKRVTSTGDSLRMPPRESNKHLTPAQVELLKRWIDEGAEYQGHWSFLPVALRDTGRETGGSGGNAIDEFVITELARQGLRQAAQAEPSVLARRAAFDLTGLPPTPQQVTAFAADPSDTNYEKLVDELLASPRYGERMAMWWLDLVRYADSVGYHGDQAVSVFPYREWVIRSFNDNKPFDVFTREQLAGDLLPNPSLNQQVATGYNRLGMMSSEGGVQPKEYLAKYAAERVRNLGGTWLGLTTGCCECHDHKFDPLKTRDFYRLEAFFADLQEKGLYLGDDLFGPVVRLPSPQQAAELGKFDSEIAALRQQLETPTSELAGAQAEWERAVLSPQAWIPLKPVLIQSAGGATMNLREDASILVSGTNPATDTYTLEVPNPPGGITAFRLEVLPHESLPAKGPGRATNGNFSLTEMTVSLKTATGEIQPLSLVYPAASFEATEGGESRPHGKWAAAAVFDQDRNGAEWGWAIHPQFGQPNQLLVETRADVSGAPGTSLVITLAHNSPHPQHAVGYFRLSASTAPRPVPLPLSGAIPENVRAILAFDAPARTTEQQIELSSYYRSIAPLLRPVREQLALRQTERGKFYNSLPTSLTTVTVPPRTIRILSRGNWMDETGEEVLPGVPDFLPQPPAKEGRLNRLDLANWLVARDNPLVARTLVNRLWKLCFGNGLSRKLDDLGAQGEWPSHPLLLDWLAADLLDHNWDLKRSIKQIVMSATYRQSSVAAAELRNKDPFNRSLARQGRFRLDAEMVRDNALWISGLLVERVGGPSVKPYQPPGYWAHLNFPAREWQNDPGDNLYRRGVYTHWQRQYLHPSLLAFDAPSREECTAERVRSNTPLQSLVLLNDPTYVEAARVFAETILRSGVGANERIEFAFQRALSRSVKSAELTVLLDMLEKDRAHFAANPNLANELLAVGARPAASDLNSVELATWTSVARAILNLHSANTRN